MGTTAQKLTYLNDTKGLLKDSINNLGGSITSSTTFRQYATELDSIYSKLPKISGKGTAINLTPTLKSRINSELYGDTSQNGTPTPSSPIPIENVTGLQNIEVCGKNMLDTSTFYKGYVNSSGAVTSDPVQALFDYVRVEPSGTYTISSQETVASLNIVQYDINKNFISRTVQSSNPKTFTLGNTTEYIRIWCKKSDSVVITQEVVDSLKLMFEKGSSATTYEPYKGNTYEVNLGKNLINYNSTGSGKEIDFTFSGSELTLNGTTNGSGEITTTSTQPITLKPGTYTFSSTKTGSFTANSKSVAIYLRKLSDSSRIVELNQVNSYTLESSFTLTEETKVYVQIYTNGAGFVFDNLKIQWQVEVGSKTSYSPYFTPIELNKISTYEDYIRKSTGINLFDKSNANVLNAIINGTTGDISAFDTCRTAYIQCKPNTTYTISRIVGTGFIIGTTTNQPTLGMVCNSFIGNNTATSITIPTGANDNYLCVFYYNSGSDTLTEEQIRNSIMIQEGSTASPYEPYGKVWYITKNIGKYVYNNDLTNNSATADKIEMLTPELNIVANTRPLTNIAICNMMGSVLTNNTGLDGTTSAKKIRVNMSTSYVSSYDEFRTLASNNNLTIYYGLLTPTTTEITNTELIEQLETLYNAKSKDGTTNISVDGTLPMILSVSTLKGAE